MKQGFILNRITITSLNMMHLMGFQKPLTDLSVVRSKSNAKKTDIKYDISFNRMLFRGVALSRIITGLAQKTPSFYYSQC